MTDCKYNYKGQWYSERELLDLPEFQGIAIQEKERQLVLSDAGERTFENLEGFNISTGDPEERGVFDKYIEFKEGQLVQLIDRLNKIKVLKKSNIISEAEKQQGMKGLTQDELVKLNKLEREIKLRVDGKEELHIKGLKQEIAELRRNADTNAVGFYAERDLERLDKLANSDDIDDLREAEKIISFYKSAGDFTWEQRKNHPFFSEEEMFATDIDTGDLTATHALSDEVMKQFKDWAERAELKQNLVNKRQEEVTTNIVNTDFSVKKTYGDKQFSIDELLNRGTGLADADYISMWTMDITKGIFSHNGILPQVMFSYLVNNFEKKLAWARSVEERIDALTPGVQKALISMGYSLRSVGILGLKGASYQLFKEITKEGNETGGLVRKFAKEYFDASGAAKNKFWAAYSTARLNDGYTNRANAYNKAFRDYKQWKRNNTIIMDTNLMEAQTLEGDAYRQSMVNLLGQKEWDNHVQEQKSQLERYDSERQSTLETLMENEGVADESSLSVKAKEELASWENNHSPENGIKDYHSVNGVQVDGRQINSYMDYNVLIPRKFVPKITINQGQYEFEDTNQLTGHYNTEFEKIESNKELSAFYDVMKEVCETIRENTPYEIQQKMAVNTLPALMKTSAEMIADKSTGFLSSMFNSFRHLMEKVRLGFGVNKQSEISYAVLDPKTGKPNYKVNDGFLRQNTKAVEARMLIEKTQFLQDYNKEREIRNQKLGQPSDPVKTIRRFSSLPLSSFGTASLLHLAKLINVDISAADIQAGRIDAIRAVTGENVKIGEYIKDYSQHTVVQSQSFDLSKIAKYFSHMTMKYAAREEALPILEIMKKHYQSIVRPKTQNVGLRVFNKRGNKNQMDGLRTNANAQFDDWFERVVLDNYGLEHAGTIDEPNKSGKLSDSQKEKVKSLEDRLNAIDPKDEDYINKTEKIKKKIHDIYADALVPKVGSSIYTKEERAKLGEIQKLMEKETDLEALKRLQKLKDSMGKERTATAFFDNLLAWTRTLRLGYNFSSASTNLMEGVISNIILAAQDDYFDAKELYYGYGAVKHSFLKNLSFGYAETPVARKVRSLMDKYNVLMDSTNELQKSSHKSYSAKLEWANPHQLNKRVEYINQSPIMIAMLRTIKIKDDKGQESSVWDAMDSHGNLKPEFKTAENMDNWEHMSAAQYLNFKQKLHNVIVLGHGNYDELRGMMIKSNTGGKALMMFKTWLPMQLYWRFAKEQTDIQSGKTFKGRYKSYTGGSGAVHGAVTGTLLLGPMGAIPGYVLGAAISRFYGTKTDRNIAHMIQDSAITTLSLAKKMLGMPVNLISGMAVGKRIIKEGATNFNYLVGKGKFTEADAKNLRANMADLAIQMWTLIMMMGVKAMFWDDDKEKIKTAEDYKRFMDKRKQHNILMNRLMSTQQQMSSYTDPVAMYNTWLSKSGFVQMLTDLSKEMSLVANYLDGNDIASSGPYAGQSQLWRQTKKIAMPGLFKDFSSFGFESQSQRVFQETPFHKYFVGDRAKDAKQNKSDRATYQMELEQSPEIKAIDDLSERKKAIKEYLNDKYPTPSQLDKMEMSRKDYDKWYKEQNSQK